MKKHLLFHSPSLVPPEKNPPAIFLGNDLPIFQYDEFYFITSFAEKNIVYADDLAKKLLGIDDSGHTIETFYVRIHPHDRNRILAVDKALQKIIYRNLNGARSMLPQSSSVSRFRMELKGWRTLEIKKTSKPYKIQPNGQPTYIIHRCLIVEDYAIWGDIDTNYRTRETVLLSNDELRLHDYEKLMCEFVSKELSFIPKRRFTKRQKEICRYILDSLTSYQISKILGISKRTVDTHRGNIKKIGMAISKTLDTAEKVAKYLRSQGKI